MNIVQRMLRNLPGATKLPSKTETWVIRRHHVFVCAASRFSLSWSAKEARSGF